MSYKKLYLVFDLNVPGLLVRLGIAVTLNAPQFSDGLSTLSITRTSMGILEDSNFRPSRSSSALRSDGAEDGAGDVPGTGGIDEEVGGAIGGIGVAAGGKEGATSRAKFKSISNTPSSPVFRAPWSMGALSLRPCSFGSRNYLNVTRISDREKLHRHPSCFQI